MWIFTSASLSASCWRSVLTAMNSTPEMPASIIRLTAVRPAPPTPTTRMTARYAESARGARCSRGGGSGSGSSRRAMPRSGCSSCGGAIGSGAFGTGRGSSGLDAGAGATSSRGGTGGGCSTVSSSGSPGTALPSFSAWRCAASVARNSSASGPSRMLARFRAIEHLLRELPVRRCGVPRRVVLEHRAAFDRRLGVTNGLLDARLEDELAEVLLQDLDRLAGVQGPAVEHRREDSLDLDVRVQVLPDHRERVLELDEAAKGQVLTLDGHD